MTKRRKTSTGTGKNVRFSVLEQRGWNGDLRSLHLPAPSGWFDMDEVARIERTAAFQHDAERVAAGKRLLLSRADLKDRGWTPAMIASFIGEPHVVLSLKTSGKSTMHFFRAEIAEEIEAGEEFAARIEDANRRSEVGKTVAQRRAADVLAAAQAKAESLEVRPPVNRAELERLAVAHRNMIAEERGRDSSTSGVDDETLDRWCGNYLRHACSNYHSMLAQLEREFAGVPGVQEIYEAVVRPKIDTCVDEAMRELAA
ncbi:hypothetical protein BSP109_00470 [Brevibacterium sp. Mu109]|uniref:hypothetical protein n=1 Tax=Brevibacterium sp. Mu109 TaxID=1255669 RepID=UPI000C6BB180|nr:hypothetical protein [Brevibacterium sp. Mu109]SMX68055.1 hypothetical protein BSP109_00470 [Brevibacterium sp. Mu109]